MNFNNTNSKILNPSWSRNWTSQITNVIITPITGGNRITFTSVAGTQTEIWASIDGAAYALLTTLNIGVQTYDHTGLYAEIVDYKLRSKLITLSVPSTLSVAIITGGLRLTWADNNTDATHIEIYANIAGGGYSLLTTVTAGTQAYDHVITTSVVYYKIRAKNTEFFSDYSSEVYKTAPAPPYDTDAVALFSRMTALSETPSDARKQIISDAFTLGKTKAFWAKTDCIYLLASHGTLSSRLNILANRNNITLVSTPTFVTDRGWTGDGGTKYIDTNYNPSTNAIHLSLNSTSIGVYSRTNNKNAKPIIGTTTGTNSYIQYYTDGFLYSQINSATYFGASKANIQDMLISVRPDNTTINVYIGNSKTSQAKGSSAIANANVLICQDTNQVSFAIVGGAFTDQDVADIITVFKTGYLTSLGANI
jgi:hypothetical protein